VTSRAVILGVSALSATAMLYVGAYQIRAIQHLSCPLLKHGCEAVADASFARPFGVPDGFIAAGLYAAIILLALFDPHIAAIRYSVRSFVIFAALANVLGVLDMAKLGAFCFYCLLTTVLTPILLWASFRF
jgi:uncharacterized membrane protein